MAQNSEVVLGIDLGTTNSAVALIRGNTLSVISVSHAKRILPSIVFYGKNDTKLVGDQARDKMGKSDGTVIYQAKRFIGKSWDDPTIKLDVDRMAYKVEKDPSRNAPCFRIDDRITKKPEEVSADILVRLRQVAQDFVQGGDVSRAVITIPAYFNDAQREATKVAAEIAGLKVVKLLAEPTAAALAYGSEHKLKDGDKIVVFDLGGGTFDVSVLIHDAGVFDVQAIGGDTRLGGADFDAVVYDMIVEVLQREQGSEFVAKVKRTPQAHARLRRAAEEYKELLSNEVDVDTELSLSGEDFPISLNRGDFEKRAEALFQQCMQHVQSTVKDSKIGAGDFDHVLMVGGSTYMPRIKMLLKSFFGKDPIYAGNPAEVVAIGAAYVGANEAAPPSERKTVLLDVTPKSLGVAVEGYKFGPLIMRNSKIPYKNSGVYGTASNFQKSIKVQIFEGEAPLVRDNRFVGEFDVNNIPPGRAGEYSFDICFQLDANGMLFVNATCREKPEINGSISCSLKKDTSLNPADVEAAKVQNERAKEAETAFGKLEKLFAEMTERVSNQPISADFRKCLDETRAYIRTNKNIATKNVDEIKQLIARMSQFSKELPDWFLSVN